MCQKSCDCPTHLRMQYGTDTITAEVKNVSSIQSTKVAFARIPVRRRWAILSMLAPSIATETQINQISIRSTPN
jgi:hypothetical protein